MGSVDQADNFDWVRAYFKRMLLEPERAEQVLSSIGDFDLAREELLQCRDTADIDTWMARYTHRTAQLRCRNAWYQHKCSQGLQRLSLKKSLHQELMALAAAQGFTINQTVAYLLNLHLQQKASGDCAGCDPLPPAPVVDAVAESAAELEEQNDAYREQMILWALCRSTGRKDED